MFKIPKKYSLNKKIAIKDFIPKNLKSDVKKNLKKYISKVVLTYQILGDEIPTVENDRYIYKVIQVYDFEITDIKKAGYINNIYQALIKSPCILRIHDTKKEVYSFGLKRLNQNDKTQIILDDILISNSYDLNFPSLEKARYLNILSYENTKNRINLVSFYLELFIKSLVMANENIYTRSKQVLESNIWYDEIKMMEFYELFKNLLNKKIEVEKTIINSEKIKLNKEISNLIDYLDNNF